MSNLKSVRVLLVVVLLPCVAGSWAPAHAQSAREQSIENGLAWLSAAQEANGSWGGSTSRTGILPTTVTVMETLRALGKDDLPGYAAAASWLREQQPGNTDFLSERMQVLCRPGTDRGLLLSYLDKSFGAWGGFKRYRVNLLDTALALQALRTTSYSDTGVINQALAHLLHGQNGDGGFGFTSRGESNVFVTAMISMALLSFPATTSVSGAIAKTAAFLRLHQNEDGGFGSSPSTVHETALAYLALAGGTTDVAVLQGAAGYLGATQLPDGSWGGDAYSTALALRVLSEVRPNLAVTPDGITFSNGAPTAGETITFLSLVRNTGTAPASDIRVQFHLGNPSAGGALLGEASIPSIAAGGSASASITWVVPAALSSAVFVTVDPLDTIHELDETDNVSWKNIAVATPPDLGIASSDISFEPPAPVQGSTVLISAAVRNTGETAAANVSVELYDGDPSLGGVPMGGTTMGSLAAGGSVTVQASTEFGAGPHQIYVVIDRANTVAESNETNNTANKTLQVGGGAPDLAVYSRDISFNPVAPVEGSLVVLNGSIHNAGEAQAENVAVRFFLGDPDAGGAPIGSDIVVPAVPARGEVLVTMPWDTTGHAGNNAIFVKADPSDIIVEANELNNCAFRTLAVAARTGPDLTVSRNIVFSPSSPNAGEDVVITAVVQNSGTADAANVLVELSLGDPRVGGTLIFGSRTIPMIEKGGSATAQLTWNTGDRTGTYDIYVTADTFNEIVEANENNNSAWATLKISGPEGPDLVVESMDSEGMVTDTQSLQVSGEMRVSIWNKGNSPSNEPFQITVFEDRNGNGALDELEDLILGKTSYSGSLAAGASGTVGIPVSGRVLFRDNLAYAMVDSGDVVPERDETNNLKQTGQKCMSGPSVGALSPVEKWSWRGSSVLPNNNQVMQAPVVARLVDTNGDGVVNEEDAPIIVFVTFGGSNYAYGGAIRAVRGDTGQEVFTISTAAYLVPPGNTVAVGDIDGDGLPEIVACKGVGGTIAFENDGSFKWSSPYPSRNPYLGAFLGAPALVDLDHDGTVEIVIGSTVLNNDGSFRWQGTGGRGWDFALAADLDLDGYPEVIAGNTAYGRDGSMLWQATGVDDGFAAVADFDGDGFPEIVVVASGRVSLLDRNGGLRWQTEIPGGIYDRGYGGNPTIADFDGDGHPEIGVAGGSRYAVFKADGSMLWQSSTSDKSSQRTGSSVFDFNGDGQAEVVYGDEHDLRIYNGKDGQVLFDAPNSTGTLWEYPVVADVDNDGKAELIVSASDYAWGENHGIRVFEDANDSWVKTRAIWNQYTYHITNVNDDGTIPRFEQNNWEIYNSYRCNSLMPEVALATPDVTVSYITVDQAGYPSSVAISARIGNGGGTRVGGGVSVSFHDGDPVQGGTFIGTAQLSRSLEPGDYEDVSVTWYNPSAGSHAIYVVADSDNAFKECREDNNSASASITPGQGPPSEDKLPDLSISPVDVTIIPPGVIEGQPAAITAVVHNAGALGAADVAVSFFDGDPNNGGTHIGSVTKSSIDAGATAMAEAPWDTFGEAGRSYIHVVVDPDDRITEVTKSNNSTLVAVDLTPPSRPDLVVTASDISFSNRGPREGEPLTVVAAVHNLGTETSDVEAALHDGNPASGGALLSQAVMPVIIPFGGTATVTFTVDTMGMAGQHDFYVVLDPANKIDEAFETNNTAWSTATVGQSGLTLAVSTDKPVYSADEDARISVSVANLSNAERSGTLSVRVLDASGNVAAAPCDEPVSLDAAESKLLAPTWNTGETLAGSYRVSCSFTENGYVVARAETPMAISPVKAVSSRVAVDKLRYAANGQVTVTSTIISQSPNCILHGLTAGVAIRNSAGDVLFSEQRPLQDLARGGLIQLESSWSTGSNPEGTYAVTLAVLEGGVVLSASDTSFEVLGSGETGAGLSGTIGATPNPVYVGQREAINWTLSNNGNEDLGGLTLAVILVAPDSGEIKSSLSTPLDLAMHATKSGTFVFPTHDLKPGAILAVLQVSSAAMARPKTLGSTAVKVEAGIEASKTIPDTVNLLVWVNARKCRERTTSTSAMTCETECVRGDVLERMLNDAAIPHRIVYSGKDFKKELRSSIHTDFLILGDRGPLEDHLADELREQVHSGKGLISSLYLKHGECGEEGFGALLGIRYKGRLPGDEHSIELFESPVSPAGTLDAAGDALKVKAVAAGNVLAWFESSSHKAASPAVAGSRAGGSSAAGPLRCPVPTSGYPAMVANTYGLGKTLFLAFDLGATLGDDNNGRLSTLVGNAVSYVHRPRPDGGFRPGQLVPVEITVASLGGTFDLDLVETWPEAVRVFDPETSARVTDNPWTRSLTLDAGESRKLLYHALTPEATGTFTLLTDVASTNAGASHPWQTLTVDLTVDRDIPGMLDDIAAKLNAIQAPRKDSRKIDLALGCLDKVKERTAASEHDIEANIRDILQAVDYLMSVTTVDITGARLLIDELLQVQENLLHTWSARLLGGFKPAGAAPWPSSRLTRSSEVW